MRFAAKFLFLCSLFCLGTTVVHAQIPYPNPFRHVIVIFEENRTPDNLFHGLLNWPGINPAHYDLASWGVNSKGNLIPLGPVPLGIGYDLSHAHSAFVSMYDDGKMDGADKIPCSGTCTIANPQFKYVDNSKHVLDPYFTLAAEYGWANAMFQTNQGPSYPAHQFIFGGTSAPSEPDDRIGVFISENPGAPKGAAYNAGSDTGCLAPLNEWNWLIDAARVETKLTNNPLGRCVSRETRWRPCSSVVDSVGSITRRRRQIRGGRIPEAPFGTRPTRSGEFASLTRVTRNALAAGGPPMSI